MMQSMILKDFRAMKPAINTIQQATCAPVYDKLAGNPEESVGQI
jgi:hypothetical protein